jgi:hypothetical protein
VTSGSGSNSGGDDESQHDPLAALEQRHLEQRERARQIKAQLGL